MSESSGATKTISISKGHGAQGDALQKVLETALDLLADKIVERLQRMDLEKVQRGKEGLLDANEAANILGLSKHWLYKNSNRLPFAVKVGGALRFERYGLERWLETHRK